MPLFDYDEKGENEKRRVKDQCNGNVDEGVRKRKWVNGGEMMLYWK